MKQLSFLLAFISVSAFGQKIDTVKIMSVGLDQERKLWIYTPWQYEEYPDKKLEVVYVFDAQAREYFDLVHSTLQFLGGEEKPFIVVGIESPYIEEKKQSRNTDFLPKATDNETIQKQGLYIGKADKFLNYVKTEVIPYIDKKYRTFPKRVAIGHSNGGTFISYCLLNEPDLFDAYIAISPNYAYDNGQLVKLFTDFNVEGLKTEKFIFISNSNENTVVAEKWREWTESNKRVIEILKDNKFKSKIHLETMDFSTTENHSTSFPIGVFYGLKFFIDYQFRTAENVIAYYDQLANQNLIMLTPEITNALAYYCFWNEKTNDAIKIINWAIEKFPNDYNLYDSQGEFYEKIGELNNSKNSYRKAMDILTKTKNGMDEKEFNEKMQYYTGKLNSE